MIIPNLSYQIEREMGSAGFLITYFAAGIFGSVVGPRSTDHFLILTAETFLEATLRSLGYLQSVPVVPFLVP